MQKRGFKTAICTQCVNTIVNIFNDDVGYEAVNAEIKVHLCSSVVHLMMREHLTQFDTPKFVRFVIDEILSKYNVVLNPEVIVSIANCIYENNQFVIDTFKLIWVEQAYINRIHIWVENLQETPHATNTTRPMQPR